MDLQKTDPDEGLMCSTPLKQFPPNIVTSTPTCSTTGDNDDEPANKRRKFFCTGSPDWGSELNEFDSFEEESPTKTPAQNSFEITCNELKLINSVVLETQLLIEEIDNEANEKDPNRSLIAEKKEILQKELSQLIDEKSRLENSVRSQASLYNVDKVIDTSFLNDTVLSNLNATLKNQPDDNEISDLEGTLINISDDSDQFHVSSNEITVKYNNNNNWSKGTTLYADTESKTLNDTIQSKSSSVIEFLNKNLLVNEIEALSSQAAAAPPTHEICQNDIALKEAADYTEDQLVIELQLPPINKREADILLPEDNTPSDCALVQDKCKNNNILKEVAQSTGNNIQNTALNLSIPCKSFQTSLPTADSDGNNQFQRNIDFDNSIINIAKQVIHKLDNIKSETELCTKFQDNNKYLDNKRVNKLCNFYEKLQSICVAVSSLQGKHNSSQNIKLSSEYALQKCEKLINTIRNEYNLLLEESSEDNDAIRAIIGVIKKNAQYVYEVIHAIVYKTDLASVRAPYISDDNKENEDNYDPKWEALRQLETDEERYKAVRKRWLNLGIPDPHSNLTFRSRRYTRNDNNNYKPIGNNSRTEDYERFYEIKAEKMKDDYLQAIAELNVEELLEIDELFIKHKQEQDDLITNCHRYTYAQTFRDLYSDQMQETRLLKADYGYKRRDLYSNHQSKQDSLRSQKNEAYSFLKFYDGLNGQKCLKMSKTELKEAEEIDDMISNYEGFYKR